MNKSLDAAQSALTELSKQSGRDLSVSARGVYKDLGKFITSARRHSSQLSKALARDFAQAQKALAKSTTASSTRRTTTRSTPARSGGSRATSSRSTSGSSARRTSTTAKRSTRTKK